MLRYISLNPQDEPVLSAILRNYPGIYELPSALNLSLIGRKSGKSEKEIREVLEKLKKRDIIEYDARSNDATLTFTEVREDEHTINRVSKYLESQNRRKSEQLESVIDYVSNHTMCRQNLLLLYFGEKPEGECGNCSYCIGKKPSEKSAVKLSERIEELLEEGKMNSREIENRTGQSSQAIIFALRELLENGSIALEPDNRYSKIK